MEDILFNPTLGIAEMITWLAESTDGLFFIIAAIVIFGITYFPMSLRYGSDWPLLASSLGTMLFLVPIYFAGGISEEGLFLFIIISVVALVKVAIFKDN